MHDLCTAAVSGEIKRARDLNARLIALHRTLFVESNPIPVKWAVCELGLIGPGIRLPLTPLSTSFHEVVRRAMRQGRSWAGPCCF
jgi:4-hydroxy-tetrahydrodipicolinate synthase